MARTKQSARKSTGGKAPKKQLATKAARKFVCYLTSQQNSGQINEKGEEKKTIFINCENTFRQFQFQRFQLINEVFQPIISLGRVNNLINNKQSNLYMRFDIASCLDGMGIFNIGRPSIDLCFVIDVSGSMGSQFPSDSDRRPKLSVAKSCLQSILPKLTESDRISIIQFDDRQELLLPLSHVSNSTIEKIEEILTELTPRGGTSLGSGIAAGFKHLLDADSIIPPDSLITDIRQKRTKRVIFMTDMESTPQDETDVIKFSQEAVQGIVPVPQVRVNSMFAPSTNKSITPTTSSTSNQVQQSNNISSNSVFTSIIGIGVDLSVNTIERISAIPGARYISAVTAQEFMSVVAEEFPYDITPIGFDIKITLPPQYTINRIYGASELNSITDGSSNFTISSEFANPLNSIQNTNTSEVEYGTDGGILLIRLNEVSNNSKKVSFNDNPNNNSTVFSPRRSTRNKSLSSPSPNTNNNDSDENETKLSTIPLQDNFVRVEWTDIQNYKHHCDLALPIIQPLNEDEKTSENCDIGLRKAVALMTYVDCLERYGTKPELPFYLNNGIANQIQDITNLSFLEICSMKSLQTLPYYNFIPEHFIKTHEIIQQFQQLKGFLVQSLLECSDDTIFSSNQNILQTVNQVIDLEILELKSDYKEIEDQVALIRLNEKNNEKQEHANLDDKNCPYSYLCPISLTIMKNPVIASDGHSYERESIEEWLKTKNTSPVTNLPLPNQYLIDNHTLRSAIEEYLSKKNENKNNEDDDDDDDDSNGGTTLTKNITPSKRGRSNTSRGRSVKRGR